MAVYRRILAASNSSMNFMKRYYSVDDLRNQKQSSSTNAPDTLNDMISRRKILSRSRDDLNTDNYAMEEEEDVWYHKEKLFKDHVQEVIDKWTQIDDEIWAKVICFERNRRIAKAYARAPVLTINGSDDGFDGYRIGLLGFDNPLRDSRTEEAKRSIGHGVKIKMDDAGNILIKRVSKANVYIKDVTGPDDSSVSAEGLKLPNGALEMDKPMKLFDMRKFQQNVSKELKRAYPDRRKLEYQCVSAVAFVKNDAEVLECPCWVMIINIVAMDMLKSKLPPVQRKPSYEFRTRAKLPDEDPYSVPGSGSSSSSRDRRTDRPPKLPPRDTGMTRYPIPKPDYEELQLQQLQQQQHADENKYRIPHLQSSRKKATNFPDDPYYCGMKAHTPNFAANGSKNKSGTLLPGPPSSAATAAVESPYAKTWMMAGPYPGAHQQQGPPNSSAHHHHQQQQKMQPPSTVRALRRPQESIYDTGLGSKYTASKEDHYSRIYGKLSLPRFVNNFRPRTVYVGEWE